MFKLNWYNRNIREVTMLKYQVMQMILDSKIEFLYSDSEENYSARAFTFRKNVKNKINSLITKVYNFVGENGGFIRIHSSENFTKLIVSESSEF
jgi:hypothetical protein